MTIFIAYDDLDDDLGEYFTICATDMKVFFENLTLPIHEINNRMLNQIYVDITLNDFIEIPFIFIAYSHGSNCELLSNGQYYLKKNENIKPFKNSLLYSFACEAGQSLGNNIVATNGGHGFFGYTNKASVYSTYLHLFSDCANEGIKRLMDNFTFQEAYDAMVLKYNNHIDEVYFKNFLVASILMENRDGLVFNGNRNSTLMEIFQ